MALSTLAKEQENFLRYAILIVDHSREALQDLVELNIKNKHLTFKEFLDKNQHEIYHLCYDFRCCQCQNSPTKRKRIIFPSQLELLFDKYNKLPSHRGTGHNDFCCSYAKVGITSQVLDLSLARCLLVNFCLDVFWFTCLTSQGQTLEKFLNLNKHIIYHLWKNNQNCCQCTPGFIFPCNSSLITENDWKSMYSSQLSPCENDRKRMSTGSSSVCSVGATPGIATQDINPEIQRFILQKCNNIIKTVDILVEQRNLRFAHVPEAKISDSDFRLFFKDIENHLLGIARVCGKETHVIKTLRDLLLKPLSINMLSKYEKLLHKNMEAINKNINLQHRTTRQSIPKLVDKSSKVRKIEERVDALETSVAKITEEVKDLSKIIKEQSKRQRLIDQTSAEIESHVSVGTYLEVGAVKDCVQLLESRNVVILSGREGSGKSRNGLEILRQLKEKNKDFDVFKLIRLTYVSDIVKYNVTSVVLFDDVFDKTSKQFSYDNHILDHLNSYITRNKVKLIFTMRNSVRHACHTLLSTHILFYDLVDIDLNSKKFMLNTIEKVKMLTNYCDINKILISEGKEANTDKSVSSAKNDDNETNQSVTDQAVRFLKKEMLTKIITTDPFLGFPECCRLFTENRNNTSLDVSCFQWPSAVLVNDIEKLRMEGINNYCNGLKYVILILILTKGYLHERCQEYLLDTERSLVKRNIDPQDCKQLLKICYNMNVEVHTSDIEHVCQVLTERYLVNIDGAYYFQHKAIQDSVLISYSKISSKDIIPLLSFDHLEDIVRLHNYTEQEDEIVIKITQPNYPEFAKKIISIINRRMYDESELDRFMESKIFKDVDVDLIYELIDCLNNEFYYQSQSFFDKNLYTLHYFPLYLLIRNIEKLDDKRLTVNHTIDQMLISVTIRDTDISICVNANVSMQIAFRSKYKDIIEWLLKNTDHLLLNFANIFDGPIPDRFIEYTKLILENVKHNMIDMTKLFIYVCSNTSIEEIATLDWIVDNVDNSSIDYHKCIERTIDEVDIVLHIMKKVNHRWLNINEVVKICCEHACSEIVEWTLKNTHHESFDVEELINVTIDGYDDWENVYYNHECCLCFDYIKILELFIFQIPGFLKCFDLNRLYEVGNNKMCCRVIELSFKHDGNLSIKTDQIIEDLFQHWDNDEHIYGSDQYYNVYCREIIQLLMKYYLNNVNVNKIFEKACQFGIPNIVEDLLLEKLDNVSYYLDITLDKLRYRQLNDVAECFDTGHGKILMLLLPRINYNSINLNGVMNDVCNIGHSPAVLWLLENERSYRFDMRNVMNKACYHGELKLVKYLFRTLNADDFDYKTAMLKACRNVQRETLPVCKWLWENIDHGMFDMKAALNNASRHGISKVVEWILNDVDKELFDFEAAVLWASEHGNESTLQLLLNQSCINMIDIQSALTSSCRNERSCLCIAKLLYGRADKLTLNINAVLSDACKYSRSDLVQWIIETCDQKNITVTETRDGNKHLIKSTGKHLVDMDMALTCILNMDDPDQKKENNNETKKKLIWLILTQCDPKAIYIYELLTESCKQDWVGIFQWIVRQVNNADLNIGEVINVACQNGAFKIVKWSLENIDIQLLNADNIMIESCGSGWLECLVLVQMHCNQYKLHAAMVEACTYGRLDIANWFLQNCNYKYFNLPLLLKETGRNGWTHIFLWLVTNFHFYNSDLQIATKEALVNGNLKIIELMLLLFGRDAFNMSTLPNQEWADLKNENVVNFLLWYCGPQCLDLSKIMTNACKFGWKNLVSFIIDNNSNCIFDSALGLIDISSFITGKHVNCLCDFTPAFNTACINGEDEIVQLLIENVNHKIFAVQNTMLYVCIKGWNEIALVLLDNFEHTRLDIGNALIEACCHGEIDVVQAILRKVKYNLLDIKTALNGACENHMHEELVLWILKNINHEQLDLTNVRRKAVRHNWRTVQLEMPEVDIEGLNQIEQETETDYIVIQ